MSELIRPEAFYAGPQDGKRMLLFFFEAGNSTAIPRISELFFREVEA